MVSTSSDTPHRLQCISKLCTIYRFARTDILIGGSRGSRKDVPPPPTNFLQFHAVSGNFFPNSGLSHILLGHIQHIGQMFWCRCSYAFSQHRLISTDVYLRTEFVSLKPKKFKFPGRNEVLNIAQVVRGERLRLLVCSFDLINFTPQMPCSFKISRESLIQI